MKQILCRHCFDLFRYDEIGVLCRSPRCSRVPDSQGRERPRFINAKAMGLWLGWRGGLDLDAPCPHCEQIGALRPACPLCRGQLDLDVGDVVDRVIAVVGASRSGKSHYLATVLRQLLEGEVGGDLWTPEMRREDRRVYRRELLEPLFEDLEELPQTRARLGQELRLTLEHRGSGAKTLLVFRDLGGELFRDPRRLARLSFLRYAQGVVLMADPLAYPPPDPGDEVMPWTANGQPTAADILDTYTAVLESQERFAHHRALPLLPEQKFLAVAVTKADFVLPEDHLFRGCGDDGLHLKPGYWSLRAEEDRKVRKWVRDHLGRELAEVADAFADVAYFFVSSYGYSHRPGDPLSRPPEPCRVHEPIFALLDRLGATAPISGGGGRASGAGGDDEL